MNNFICSFQSEWLKTKRSLAFWLVIIGGFFIPLIMLIKRLIYNDNLYVEVKTPMFWNFLMNQSWQLMAIFLLPMGVIIATSLITQIEFKNNTWKQLHTTPQAMTVIFWSKFAVILVMLLEFFIFFNLGIFISGALPSLVFIDVDYPTQVFPFLYFLKSSTHFFIDCLPIVAIQYLVSLHYKNFLVPLSIGIGILLASIIAVEWKYGYTIPYTYCIYYFFELRQAKVNPLQTFNIHYWALGYFVAFTLISYVLYITKREKG